MRFTGLIVGILWIILMVGIVLVFLNTPGIR
jgi:tetrahydromethanopterin S-methyltransferase subunit F